MTAFAAIVSTTGDPLDPAATSNVATVLTGITGRPAQRADTRSCTLLLAPLHADDPASPTRIDPAGIIATGQVLLEAKQDLARTLSASVETPELTLIALAYQRWGERFAERITGEYAFALWDERKRTLLCARDGLGVRLLYLAQGSRTLVVSNVLTASAAHPAVPSTLDETALVEFLVNGGCVDPLRTSFQTVRCIPPGHTLTIPPTASPRLRRHWTFPAPEIERRQRDALLEGYRDALEHAVGDRIRGGPVAVFLSGGLDSTTIAAAGRRTASAAPLHAITAVYRRFSSIDELTFARMAADALRIPLTIVDADGHEALDAQSGGSATPEPLDEPTLADWRDTVGAAARLATAGLYGDDGDAVFLPPGGASLFRAQSGVRLVSAVARYAIAHRRLPYLGIRVRERARRLRRHSNPPVPAWLSQTARDVLNRAEPATVLGLAPEPLPPHPFRPRTQARLSEMVPQGLAPLASAEVTRERFELRFPLLDTRVLRFVMALPPIPWCQNKALARAAYANELPREITARPKTPVSGFYEALVASWRRTASTPQISPALQAWIDGRAWADALHNGSWADTVRAWRAIELDEWLAAASRGGAHVQRG